MLGKPKQVKPQRDESIAVRLPKDLIDEINRWMERSKNEHPGVRVSRSDAVREMLYAYVQSRSEG